MTSILITNSMVIQMYLPRAFTRSLTETPCNSGGILLVMSLTPRLSFLSGGMGAADPPMAPSMVGMPGWGRGPAPRALLPGDVSLVGILVSPEVGETPKVGQLVLGLEPAE